MIRDIPLNQYSSDDYKTSHKHSEADQQMKSGGTYNSACRDGESPASGVT